MKLSDIRHRTTSNEGDHVSDNASPYSTTNNNDNQSYELEDPYADMFDDEEENRILHLSKDLAHEDFRARAKTYVTDTDGHHDKIHMSNYYIHKEKLSGRKINEMYISHYPKCKMYPEGETFVFFKYEKAVGDQSKRASTRWNYQTLIDGELKIYQSRIRRGGDSDKEIMVILKYLCRYDMECRSQILLKYNNLFTSNILRSKMNMSEIVTRYPTKEAAMLASTPQEAVAIQKTYDDVKMAMSKASMKVPKKIPDALRGWQTVANDEIWNSPELINDRTICYIYDDTIEDDFYDQDEENVGVSNSGKSVYALWLNWYGGSLGPKIVEGEFNNLVMSRATENANDFHHYISQNVRKGWTGQNLILSLARSRRIEKDVYANLEDMKDGIYTSFKYESCDGYIENDRMVILANEPPKVEYYLKTEGGSIIKQTIAPDRWLIYQIVGGLDGQLVKRDWKEFRLSRDNVKYNVKSCSVNRK